MRRLTHYIAKATMSLMRRAAYPSSRSHGLTRLARPMLASVILAMVLVASSALTPAYAQDQGMQMQPLPTPGMDANGLGTSVNRMTQENGMGSGQQGQQMRIPEPVAASLAAAPPYGTAPLTVGFFVTANDPENIGFLTYQWNFGDGTVSALPPELYIFHVYQQPGNYVVSLVMKTVDGRSISLFTPIIVHQAAD